MAEDRCRTLHGPEILGLFILNQAPDRVDIDEERALASLR